MKTYPDVFLYGLTGSGKTTVQNYLKNYYGYRPMRNAGTIKQIVCEKNGWSAEQLEELKRERPDIRDKHHEESAYLGKESTLNRCELLATRQSIEFEAFSNPDKQLIIGDVRDHEEANIYLNHDFIGIFLTRQTSEYTAKHWTDVNIFQSENFKSLIENNQKIIIIDNPIEQYLSDEFFSELPENVEVIRLVDNVTKEELEEVVASIIENSGYFNE